MAFEKKPGLFRPGLNKVVWGAGQEGKGQGIAKIG